MKILKPTPPAKHQHDYQNDIVNKPTLGTMAAVDDAPSDGKTYGRRNGAWAEASGGGGGSVAWGSITGTLSDQTDLQNALNAKADLANEIMYFTSQTVSVASSAQIMRIPASGTNPNITTDTIVLSCIFADPTKITSDVNWQSYSGYVTFTGTCTSATTAEVILGQKGN